MVHCFLTSLTRSKYLSLFFVFTALHFPLISKFHSLFNQSFVPSAPVKIGITVNFMFHSFCFFFSSLPRSRYLSLFSRSFNFTQCSAGATKSTIRQVCLSLEFVIWPTFGETFQFYFQFFTFFTVSLSNTLG